MSIHTCSYYCDRPKCIKAQRDELRQKLEQAVAAEREACAKLCEEDLRDAYIRQGKPARDESMLFAAIADCANAIRARGKNNG
jgi:hypothetical protein